MTTFLNQLPHKRFAGFVALWSEAATRFPPIVVYSFGHGVLSSEPKCNTPADLIIGTVDQDLRECCHAMLFAFVG
jgi:hypothetical protein